MPSDHLLLPANVQNSWRRPSPVNMPTCCCSYWSLDCSAVLSSLGILFCFFLLCCVQWPELAQIRHSHTHWIGKKEKKISRVFAVCFLSREKHASCISLAQLTAACLLIPLDGWEPFIHSGQLETSGSPSRDHLQGASVMFTSKLTRLQHKPNNPEESRRIAKIWVNLSVRLGGKAPPAGKVSNSSGHLL